MHTPTQIKISYNKEGDFLEVILEKKKGFFKETANDAVMQKVDLDGKVIGFSILNIHSLTKKENISVTL